MRQQYGLRIQGEEFEDMGWEEFADLVSGLNEQTSLIRVAQIRTETDPEVLKNFTRDQHKIRNEWQRKRALSKSTSETNEFLSKLQGSFERMFA